MSYSSSAPYCYYYFRVIIFGVTILCSIVQAKERFDGGRTTTISSKILLDRVERNDGIARCYRRRERDVVRYESFCYLPQVCFATREFHRGGGSRKLYISGIDALREQGTGTILEKVWSYGNVEVVHEDVLRDMFSPLAAKTFDDNDVDAPVVFFSVVSQGAAHYGPHTGLPVLGLSDPRIRSFLNIPRITHVWQILFGERQHEEEMWVRDFVRILKSRYGVETFSSDSGLLRSLGMSFDKGGSVACFRAVLYDGKNLGSSFDRPIHYFIHDNVLVELQRTIATTRREITSGCGAENTCVAGDIDDKDEEVAKDRNTGVYRIVLVQRRSRTRNKGLATRRFENIERVQSGILADSAGILRALAEYRNSDDDTFERVTCEIVHFEDLATLQAQAAIMRLADVVVAPHGNGLTNIMFMRPCSIVVEIFPARFRYVLFELLASQSSLVYRPYQISRASRTEGAPACLLKNEDWMSMPYDECFRDLSCRPCARSAPFVRAEYETTIRPRLLDAIRERQRCIELPHLPSNASSLWGDIDGRVAARTCECPDGRFVVVDFRGSEGNVRFYCDGPRPVRVLSGVDCSALGLGDECMSDAIRLSETCLYELLF